jgi:hypothetical protein
MNQLQKEKVDEQAAMIREPAKHDAHDAPQNDWGQLCGLFPHLQVG